MENIIFQVNEEPYCIWEHDIKQRNLEFLNGIDAEYFDYMLHALLATDDEKRASVGLRVIHHHAVETFFSLIGALIQAPNCVYAWVAKCSTPELRKVVEKIGMENIGMQKEALPHQLNVEHVSWQVISELVFSHYLPGTEKNKITAGLFATLWQRLAYNFLNESHIDEYNSLKHGFRIKSGGFAIAVGIEHEPGVACPPEEMKMIGGSEFGASFIMVEPVGGNKKNRCLKSKRTSLNWAIEETSLLLQLTAMSISNVLSLLKIHNGEKANEITFLRPTDDADFERAWSYSPSVLKGGINMVIDEAAIPFQSKKDLLEKLSQPNEE